MDQPRGDLDLPQEPLAPDGRRQVGAEHLDGDLTVVLPVVRQVDRGHAARAELALDAVALREGGSEPRPRLDGGFLHQLSGRIFWFRWKKLAGSYLVLISRSRS
jgi:hypothetical protein